MDLIKRQISKLSAFDIIIGVHSKSAFGVEKGKKSEQKSEQKQTVRGWGVKPICTFAL